MTTWRCETAQCRFSTPLGCWREAEVTDRSRDGYSQPGPRRLCLSNATTPGSRRDQRRTTSDIQWSLLACLRAERCVKPRSCLATDLSDRARYAPAARPVRTAPPPTPRWRSTRRNKMAFAAITRSLPLGSIRGVVSLARHDTRAVLMRQRTHASRHGRNLVHQCHDPALRAGPHITVIHASLLYLPCDRASFDATKRRQLDRALVDPALDEDRSLDRIARTTPAHRV